MLVSLAHVAIGLVVLLEVRASLGDEVGVEASVAEASFVCNYGPLFLVHLFPSGTVGGVVPIVPHVQAPFVLAGGVQNLADAAIIVGGATGAVPLQISVQLSNLECNSSNLGVVDVSGRLGLEMATYGVVVSVEFLISALYLLFALC